MSFSKLFQRFTATSVAALVSSMSLVANAEDYIEWVGANSGVNWSSGQVTAEGAGIAPADKPGSVGRLMACRAAVVDGQRNLLESMQGVRVNATTVVKDMMLESDVITTTVEGVLKGATIIERTPGADGTCLVKMTAPIGGPVTKAVYSEVDGLAQTPDSVPWYFRLVDSTMAWLVPSAIANDAASESTSPSIEGWQSALDALTARISNLEELLTTHPGVTEVKDQSPTGLVLDARGSNFIPSMSPKLRKLRAGVIYPSEQHQLAARDRGQLVSLFTRDLDTAKRHPAVGDRPVVLKALRTFGDTRTEIVLNTENSERLEALIKQGFLDQAGVIIVL